MNLLNIIKKELSALGVKPKKGLGQNFLVNERVYKKIVAALEIKAGDKIIEIGPGLGTLTGHLLKTGAKVVAVEKDRRLLAFLRDKFGGQKNVKIIEGDALKLGMGNEVTSFGYKLVGNIPYYITSHILKTVFEKWPTPELIVLMVQKEVAQRIVAKPPKMSLLAVSIQYFSKPETISYVPKTSFYPMPKVDSAIIRIWPYRLETSASFNQKFFRIVKTGFSGKRKQLVNNLAPGLKVSKQEVGQKLPPIGINPQRRAETLTIEEWQKITKAFLGQD